MFYNAHLMYILRELVISGGANSFNFSETDVQPSVLYSVAVPASFIGKTYQELFLMAPENPGAMTLPMGLLTIQVTDTSRPHTLGA